MGGSAEQPAGPIARGSDIQLWREWGRLTRFLGSARLAFARERHVLNSLELVNPERAKLAAPMADGVYEVGLDDHLTAIGDEEMLLASVLIHSYALAEWAAADHLGVDARSFDGIEDWGERLLTGNGLGWADVDGGLAGAVEAAVTRNAFAHAQRRIDERAAARLVAVGLQRPAAGDRITLDYPDLRRHRKVLRSLLNQGGLS